MNPQLRVLLLEDSPADADLVQHELTRARMNIVAQRVDRRDDFILALRDFSPDVILSDHALVNFNAPAALAILRTIRPATPLIVVSGAMDERMTIACLRAGAEDVVPKSEASRLPGIIRAAIALRRPLANLTPRQLQVLRLVAAGLTTPTIAQQLRLSVKTIESHRTAVMKRLDIHDVVSLVHFAIRVGLVPLAY